MRYENRHLSDEELLLAADGEASERRAAEVRAHLAACWQCRARMAEIERTIGDFVKTHQSSLDAQIPSSDGPRALLKMRLSAAARQSQKAPWWNLNVLLRPAVLVPICALALVVAFGAATIYLQQAGFRSGAESVAKLLPNRTLTPGATRPVRIGEICAMAHDEVSLPVSGVVQSRVFQEYGLRGASAEKYEVDYLISPGLGGTDDIRNLWPQPRFNTTWNSFVKDQLEDYLHRSVCAGRLDLTTAQKDVSTDWISAYKKYFATQKPLELSSANSRRSDRRL